MSTNVPRFEVQPMDLLGPLEAISNSLSADVNRLENLCIEQQAIYTDLLEQIMELDAAIIEIQTREMQDGVADITLESDTLRECIDAATAAEDERNKTIDAATEQNAEVNKQIAAKLGKIRALKLESNESLYMMASRREAAEKRLKKFESAAEDRRLKSQAIAAQIEEADSARPQKLATNETVCKRQMETAAETSNLLKKKRDEAATIRASLQTKEMVVKLLEERLAPFSEHTD